MIINVSDGKENYSQRNNEIKPLESCQVTSMVMGLDYCGYSFPYGKYSQPEDNLRAFIEEKGWNPEFHEYLSQGTNEWMGRLVTKFYSNLPLNVIMSEILSNRPVVISGAFPGYPVNRTSPLNHVVCLVGFEWEDNNYNYDPTFAIIDDPYGNTMNNWQGSGNDVKIPYELFIDWIKPCGSTLSKWGHIFYQKL